MSQFLLGYDKLLFLS